MSTKNFEERLKQYSDSFHPVVPFEEGDRFLLMDLTARNEELTTEILADTSLFTDWVNLKLKESGAKYGIGGYNENRTVYSRSPVFNTGDDNEPRSLHLGIDIWGKPYTRVMAPLDGIIHSFAFNNAFGDYGATIILTHQLEGKTFHTLYGHLSLNSIKNIQEGETIRKGEAFAEFGIPVENGHWPPHLHFQIIINMDRSKGDYPGVCKYSERSSYLENCPDPDLILKMMHKAGKRELS